MNTSVINKIDEALQKTLLQLEKRFEADLLCLNGPINPDLINLVRHDIDLLKEGKSNNSKLVVMLTTNGGDINTTERLVNIFRHNYSEVEFVIPDHAYSAGTILCMSGDKIWMNYNSVLGPIDPQVLNKEGKYVPALGYIEKIKELLDKAKNNEISQAEFLILKDFDLAELRQYEQAINLTVDLLKEWLVKYKFKNWKIHNSSNRKVTENQKKQRAEKIAKDLGDYNRWKSHGRPLDIETMRDLKLVIDDFGENKQLEKEILDFHGLFEEYMELYNAGAMLYSRR